MGVASGCGCKEDIDFLKLLIPIYSSCIYSFLQQHPYFLFICFNVFRSCSSTFFKLNFMYKLFFCAV